MSKRVCLILAAALLVACGGDKGSSRETGVIIGPDGLETMCMPPRAANLQSLVIDNTIPL